MVSWLWGSETAVSKLFRKSDYLITVLVSDKARGMEMHLTWHGDAEQKERQITGLSRTK